MDQIWIHSLLTICKNGIVVLEKPNYSPYNVQLHTEYFRAEKGYLHHVIKSSNCNICGEPDDILQYFAMCSGVNSFCNNLKKISNSKVQT